MYDASTLARSAGACGTVGVLVVGAPAWASALWDPVTEVEGMQVARRLLSGTGRYEVRVSTAAPFPPQVIFETLWRHHEYPDFVPYLKHLTILQQAPNEKVIYEQIRMSLVRDRDYTVKVTAEREPATGRMQITSCRHRRTGRLPRTATSGSRPSTAQDPGPTRDGGTLVTYVVSSDPGGATAGLARQSGAASSRACLGQSHVRSGQVQPGPHYRATAVRNAAPMGDGDHT